MGAAFIVNSVWGYDLGWNQETVGTVIGAMLPIAIYFWPNLQTPT